MSTASFAKIQLQLYESQLSATLDEGLALKTLHKLYEQALFNFANLLL